MFFNTQPMQKIPLCQPVGAATRANPANTREWIVLLKKGAGTSFFLVDDQEQVESFDAFIEVAGQHSAEVIIALLGKL